MINNPKMRRTSTAEFFSTFVLPKSSSEVNKSCLGCSLLSAPYNTYGFDLFPSMNDAATFGLSRNHVGFEMASRWDLSCPRSCCGNPSMKVNAPYLPMAILLAWNRRSQHKLRYVFFGLGNLQIHGCRITNTRHCLSNVLKAAMAYRSQHNWSVGMRNIVVLYNVSKLGNFKLSNTFMWKISLLKRYNNQNSLTGVGIV